jgi:hypothetical protein
MQAETAGENEVLMECVSNYLAPVTYFGAYGGAKGDVIAVSVGDVPRMEGTGHWVLKQAEAETGEGTEPDGGLSLEPVQGVEPALVIEDLPTAVEPEIAEAEITATPDKPQKLKGGKK